MTPCYHTRSHVKFKTFLFSMFKKFSKGPGRDLATDVTPASYSAAARRFTYVFGKG